MADFVTPILTFLKECWPLRVVQIDEEGVLKWGDRAWRCPPRRMPYVFLPGIMVFESYPTKYQGIDCGTQTVDLPNDQIAVFSANVSYDVKDALVMSTEFENFDHMLEREARGCLARLFMAADDQDDGSDVDPLDIADQAAQYLRELTRDCIDIKAVIFTTFTRKVRVYRVFTGAEG